MSPTEAREEESTQGFSGTCPNRGSESARLVAARSCSVCGQDKDWDRLEAKAVLPDLVSN